MKKSQVIETVQGSVSSIYSREDVIKIINMIEDDEKVITEDQIAKVIENVIDHFERNGERMIDHSSAEFTMGYDNRIELETVGLDLDYLRESLENNLCGLVVEESQMASECGACGGDSANCDGC